MEEGAKTTGRKIEYMQVTSEHDGLTLDVLIMEPERPRLKGIIQISHGMCEAKERYSDFMEYMVEKGYACIIHDHRGHGNSVKSHDDLGYMYEGGAESLVSDLYQITCLAKKRWPQTPFIMLGHSMGSMVARVYLKKYDGELQALILSGSPSKNPGLVFGKAINRIQKLIYGGSREGKLLEKLSFGSFAAKFPNERSRFAWCCSDSKVVEEYELSPDCGFTFKLDGFQVLFQLMTETYNSKNWACTKPKLPILFMGGGDDPCIGGPRKLKKTIDHLRSVGYCNIRGKIYPGMRHEILNETSKYCVYKDIVKYLSKI